MNTSVFSRGLLRTRRSRSVWYSAAVGIAAFAIIFVGFSRTFYLGFVFHARHLDWLLNLHGLLMTGWFVLFFVQVSLIGMQRVALHRRLGWLGLVLMLLIVTVGTIVDIRSAAIALHGPPDGGPPPLLFMGFLFAALVLFASFVSAGLAMRRARGYHTRFMILACLSIVGPGLFRIPFQTVPALAFLSTGGPFGLFGLDLLLLYAAIAWDTLRNRRLHLRIRDRSRPLDADGHTALRRNLRKRGVDERRPLAGVAREVA